MTTEQPKAGSGPAPAAPSAGAVPASHAPAGDVRAGDLPAGDVPAGDVPAGDMPAGDMQAGDVPARAPQIRPGSESRATAAGDVRPAASPGASTSGPSSAAAESSTATGGMRRAVPAGAGVGTVTEEPEAQAPTAPKPDVLSRWRAGFRRRARIGAAQPDASPTPNVPSQVAAPAASKPPASKTAVGEAADGQAANGQAAATGIAGEDPQGTTKTRSKRKALPTARPPGAPPDPWTAFATTTERAPGRIRRALRAVGRLAIHEYALVTYIALTLAVILTWPTLRYPLHTMPQEVGDPARQAWQIAWAGHVLLTHPAQLWQANAYFPERYSFAFGDSLLGYAPAGMLGEGPLAATLRYNVLFVLAHALLLIGGYALVRQLGAGRTGSAVAAAAFTFAPWRLAQEGHLDIVSVGGIPLALAMLARGHGWSLRYGIRPDRRNAGWAVLGWLVAIWQVSLGFSLGLPFAGVLGVIMLVMIVGVPIRRLRRRGQGAVLGWRLVLTDGLGVLILAGVGALIALPYFKVGGSGSSTAEITFYSPPVRSLLIAPAQSRIWGGAHEVPRSSLGWPTEMTLLPGFVLYALALAGLVFSVWKWWHRLLLVLGLAAAGILTLGTTFFGGRWTYLPLFGHLPASLGLRVPGRMMVWVTLLLAILAAGAVAEFVRRAEHMSAQRVPPWPGPWLRLATLVPLMLVLVESWGATPHPVVAAQPAALRTVTAPMIVLPTTAVSDQTVQLWSTSRFQPLANGGGSFAAARQAQLRASIASFPDAPSIQYLRGLGITTVVLLRVPALGTPWERAGDVPVDALGIQREDLNETTVLFRLN